jgi:hypothetical protein
MKKIPGDGLRLGDFKYRACAVFVVSGREVVTLTSSTSDNQSA